MAYLDKAKKFFSGIKNKVISGEEQKTAESSPIRVPVSEEELIKSFSPDSDKFLETLARGGKKAEPQETAINRIPFKKLYLAYKLDEVSNRCAEFYAEQLVSPGFNVKGEEEAKEIVREFVDKNNLMIKLETVARDMAIFGNAFWEIIYNRAGEITDVQRINPIQMDFVRDTKNIVKTNEQGHPIGWEFNPNTADQPKKLNSNEVIHFELHALSETEMALGYLEPLYGLIKMKLNIRQGFGEAGYRSGDPIMVISVGDKPDKDNNYPGHKISENIISRIENQFQDLSSESKLVMPNWVDITPIEPSDAFDRDLLDYCDQRIAGAFGVPADLALGTAKAGRSILEVQMTRDLDRRLNTFRRKIETKLEEELFPKILKKNGLEDESVRIDWHTITPADLNRKAKRINDYVTTGVLSEPVARELIKDMEGIKIDKSDVVEKPEKTQGGLKTMKEVGEVTADEKADKIASMVVESEDTDEESFYYK